MGKNRKQSAGRGGGRRRKWTSLLPWGITAAALLAILVLAAQGRGHGTASHHPTPRSDAATTQARKIVPASAYAAYPRIQETYREAALVPQVLDGIYCYCECKEHMGHYSLLDCYKSDHAAGCDVCLSEGELAYKMTQQGKSLDQIRAAVDRLYGA